MIVFDALNHSYTEGEVSLPSVTTVLKAEGFYDPRVFAEGAADRGTLIHLMTQQMDEDRKGLKDFDLNPLYAYALAWDKFKTDTGAEILDCEMILGGETHGYAGTVDRIVLIRGKEYVLDIKSGVAMSWHAIQLAGYRQLLGRPLRRVCVYLKDTGKYRANECKNRYDDTVWRAALVSYRWKKEHL